MSVPALLAAVPWGPLFAWPPVRPGYEHQRPSGEAAPLAKWVTGVFVSAICTSDGKVWSAD
jgi:hypothetical protein